MKCLLITDNPTAKQILKDCCNRNVEKINTAIEVIDFLSTNGKLCGFAGAEAYEALRKPWNKVDYPFFPDKWEIAVIEESSNRLFFANISAALASGSYDAVINAFSCGEKEDSYFDLLMRQIGKPDLKILRLSVNDYSDANIIRAFENLEDFSSEKFHRSILAYDFKSKADWLFGINLTGIMSLRTGRYMPVGTLKLAVLEHIYAKEKMCGISTVSFPHQSIIAELDATEKDGIGTASSRRKTLDDLCSLGYLIENHGLICLSQSGKHYVEAFTEMDSKISDFNSYVRQTVKMIRDGALSYDDAYLDLKGRIAGLCAIAQSMDITYSASAYHCPRCESAMGIGRYSIICPRCSYKIDRSICGRRLSESNIRALFNGDTIGPFQFTNKRGVQFHARLVLGKEGIEIDYSSHVSCPVCGKDNLRFNRGGAFCDCGFKLFRKICSRELDDTELTNLIKNKYIANIHGLISRKGRYFTADIRLNTDYKTELIYR